MSESVRYTAEAVSLGHPDKCADFIASYILDRYLEKDPLTKYAVEVLLKDNTVVLGGEVKSSVSFSTVLLKKFIIEALSEIGYDERYSSLWGENAIEVSKIKLINLIGSQSSEINQGVEDGKTDGTIRGWGDQGIFMGYANAFDGGLRKDQFYAKRLAFELYTMARKSEVYGLDIKTQVTLETTGKVDTVIVAIPTRIETSFDEVYEIIGRVIKETPDDIIINGTGSYRMHSSIADCGVTGRKLAVDFYSSSCPVGGGCPWGKDASKADVSLNLYARKLAVENLADNDECFVYLSSCIGKADLPSSYIKTIKNDIITLKEFTFDRTPQDVIDDLFLQQPIFASMCKKSMKGFMLY